MDAHRFDALARVLTTAGSRRRAFTGLVSGTLSLVLGASSMEDVAAKKKCPPCKKRKKGKCKKKLPDGTACAGGSCQRGVCQLAAPPVDSCPGQKRCGGACIPTSECCTNDQCPAGSLCCTEGCTTANLEPGRVVSRARTATAALITAAPRIVRAPRATGGAAQRAAGKRARRTVTAAGARSVSCRPPSGAGGAAGAAKSSIPAKAMQTAAIPPAPPSPAIPTHSGVLRRPTVREECGLPVVLLRWGMHGDRQRPDAGYLLRRDLWLS